MSVAVGNWGFYRGIYPGSGTVEGSLFEASGMRATLHCMGRRMVAGQALTYPT